MFEIPVYEHLCRKTYSVLLYCSTWRNAGLIDVAVSDYFDRITHFEHAVPKEETNLHGYMMDTRIVKMQIHHHTKLSSNAPVKVC